MAANSVDFQHVFQTSEETREPEHGSIVGSLPRWLNGQYLRIGPGRYDFENDFTLNHVFDGYSMITKFNISEGTRVTMEKKYLETEVYKKVIRAQRPVICEFGTKGYADPGKSLFSRLIPNLIPELTDNCNMALYQLGSSLMAGCETCHFHEVQTDNLAVTKNFDSSKLFGTNTWTCHPLKDLETGITYNIGASILTGIKYNVIQIPPDSDSSTPAKDLLKRSKVLCSFPSSWYGCFSFSHSFGMTKKYLVFIEQPYVLLAPKILAAVVTKGHCFQNWLEWRPELKNNFWLIEKATGRVHKVHYQSQEAFFFLHIINCYEEAGNIVVDLLTFPNPSSIEKMTVENLRNGISAPTVEQPRGQRFVLPLFKNYNQANEVSTSISSSNLITTIETEATAVLQKDTRNLANSLIVVSPELVTEPGIELPAFNRAYLGSKYNYYYASGSAMSGNFQNAICKVDLQSKKATIWKDSSNPYVYLGEPIFVAKHHTNRHIMSIEDANNNEIEPEDEDDGVILCPASTSAKVGEPKTCQDFLVCLDAKTFTELGRINFKSQIPQGLHGLFLQS